jgi:uncharacterized membrane protein
MNLILVVLLLIALFHLFMYYWNMDFKPVEVQTDLSETKVTLEKHLNELKQYNLNSKHG